MWEGLEQNDGQEPTYQWKKVMQAKYKKMHLNMDTILKSLGIHYPHSQTSSRGGSQQGCFPDLPYIFLYRFFGLGFYVLGSVMVQRSLLFWSVRCFVSGKCTIVSVCVLSCSLDCSMIYKKYWYGIDNICNFGLRFSGIQYYDNSHFLWPDSQEMNESDKDVACFSLM